MTTMETARPPRRRGAGPEDEQRTGGNVEHIVRQAGRDSPPDLAALVASACELVGSIGEQAKRDEENYLRGWRDAARVFFDHGVEVGRQQLGNEILAEEAAFARHMSTITRMLSYAELERVRWDGPRERFSDPRPGDFSGVAEARAEVAV